MSKLLDENMTTEEFKSLVQSFGEDNVTVRSMFGKPDIVMCFGAKGWFFAGYIVDKTR